MLARMPIARLLMLGFGIISLITTIQAVAVWSSVNTMDNALRRTSEQLLPQVERIGELEVTIIRASLETRHAMLMRTPAERDATLAELNRLVKRADEIIAELDRNLSTAEGRRRLEAVKLGKNGFLAAAGQIVPLIVAGQMDAAVDMLVGKVIPARNEFLKAINHQRDWQEQLLKQSNAEALARGSRTEGLVLIVAVVTVGLGIALAIGFSRYLNRVLGGEPRDAMKSARAIASGDLTQQVPVRAGDTRSMMAELAAMRQGLTELVASVRQGVESVATASSQIASGSADLSARTEQQAANVEHTVSAVTQITQSVRTSAENAHQASQMAAAASAAAQEGGEVVNRVVSTMGEIQAGSRRIGDITGTIDGIAFQTNILALNAAVEAARAGEAGRGFAVVAAEVRALAQRSAEAAREIKTLISDSVGKVDEGDQLVKDAGQRMDQIVEQVRKVSNLLGEMSAASSEQTRSIDSVSEAVAQIDQGTQQNAALVEQSAAAADSLKQNAEQLAQTVAVFRIA